MPDNGLAPPNMPWLWQPNSPVGQPNSLGPPMLNYAAPPNPAAPTVGQGVAQTAADVAQAWPSVEEQRRMLQPLPGWQGTAVDAAKQWAEGVMMGTTAPGEVPGLSPAERFQDAFDAAHAKSGLADVSNVHFFEHGPNEVEISHIQVDPDKRGQGIGNTLMGTATDLADQHGVTLHASPASDADASAGLDYEGLRDWYQRWGFDEPGGGDRLTRSPSTTAPGDAPPPGIVAYHGSPADFNRFDDRFIGTGEGAQAYGRGHYFGGAEETGRSYRDALTPETIPNPEFNAAQQDYNAKYGAVGNAAGATDAEFNAAIAARDAAHEKMKSLPPTIPNPAFPGRMYQVSIGADPEHFLDWDKPLSEQSPHVQQAFKSLGYEGGTDAAGNPMSGGAIYRSFGDPAAAASTLQQAGVPGIRYLDQGSRASGQGTSNHVVFDANTIDILRKYGIAGLIAGGGAAAAATQQQQPSQ